MMMMIWKFLIGSRWCNTSGDDLQSATTWLELLFCYLVGGGKLKCLHDIEMCKPPPLSQVWPTAPLREVHVTDV